MAYNNVLRSLNAIAASALNQYVCVTPDTTTANQVSVASTQNLEVLGVVYQATVPTYGYAVNIAREGEVKVYFAASCGAGIRVSVASTNGAVGPAVASGPAASGVTTARVYSVGYTMEAHAAGDLGTIILDPREIV
jgi:hypothetical protein